MGIKETGKTIYLIPAKNDPNVCGNRFFGSPDLPEDFDWPTDMDGYDMEFICQFHLKELHALNPAVPEEGMLWFFGCTASLMGEPDAPAFEPGYQPEGMISVRYAPCGDHDLLRGEIVDENGDPAGFAPIGIRLSTNEDDCAECRHSVLGGRPEDGADAPEDGALLLCLDSFAGEDVEFTIPDGGYLYFLIDEQDLADRRFDRVRAYLAV